MELYHYLPIYPEFDDELDQILEDGKSKESKESKKDFYDSLYWKKEFYQNRLSLYEDKPNKPGKLLKHQIFISRFLSSHTPYNGLLLMHEPGTGKTCSSVAAIEQIRKEKTDFRKAIVIMKSDKLIRNYIRELVFVCTDGCYIPEGYYDDMSEETRRTRIKKLYSEFYDFQTYETFSKELNSYSNEIIKKLYSNCIIVIDEVHNLRRRDNAGQYNSIWRFLHAATNTKILLMTGTPMRDQSYEIADIINLILPLSKQMPTGKIFKEFFLEAKGGDEEDDKDDKDENEEEDEDEEGKKKIYIVRDDAKKELKSYFRGRISYLRAMKSDARKTFVESSLPLRLEFFHLYRVDMSDHQKKVYKESFKLDINEKKQSKMIKEKKQSSFYSKSRQSSLFVFPDGSYGNEGYQQYIQKDEKNLNRWQELKSELKGKNDEIVEKLRKYSCKYAECISKILQHPDECHFVFSNLVKGSGLILFSLLLELVGFKRATGATQNESSRYALLTGEESNAKEMNDIIESFNQPENYSGKYIRVILGSEVLSEGFTLKNIQHVHILTPSWNFSETDQVIARAFRLFSHDELKKRFPEKPVDVRIYLYCGISEIKNKDDSIDYKMYLTCEDKDVSIKSVERLMKECSIDCMLNKERNTDRNAIDGSRECEYMSCDWVCDGNISTKENIDSSTYSLYYDQEEIDEIVEIIKDQFKIFYYYTLNMLSEIITAQKRDATIVTISKAIHFMIMNNVVIKDALDHNCFLRNEHDTLYLTYNLKNDDCFFDNYYVINFPLQQVNTRRQIHNLHIERLPVLFKKMMDSFSDGKATDETYRFLEEFADDSKEMMIENAILMRRDMARKPLSREAKIFVDFIFSHYQSKILNLPEMDASIFQDKESKCLDPYPSIVWRKCTQDEDKLIRSEKKVKIPPNDYGWAGLMEGDKFKIVNTQKLGDDIKKKTEKSRGMVCSSFKKDALAELVHTLKVEMDGITDDKFTELNDKSREELLEMIEEEQKPVYRIIKEKFGDKLKNKKEFKQIDLVRLMYWLSKKDELCDRLKRWFTEHNLMYKE